MSRKRKFVCETTEQAKTFFFNIHLQQRNNRTGTSAAAVKTYKQPTSSSVI